MIGVTNEKMKVAPNRTESSVREKRAGGGVPNLG